MLNSVCGNSARFVRRCANKCALALSGQDTSKGRIKAAAHAKDGDCFVCLITPLTTTLCHLGIQQDVTYALPCVYQIHCMTSTKTTQPIKLDKDTPAMFSSESYTTV